MSGYNSGFSYPYQSSYKLSASLNGTEIDSLHPIKTLQYISATGSITAKANMFVTGTFNSTGSMNVLGTCSFGGPTNKLIIESNGYPILTGSEYPWDDLLVPSTMFKVAGVDGTEPPAYAKYAYDATRGTVYSGLYAYEFTYNADSWRDAIFSAQLPHKYKVGSQVTGHVHCALVPKDLNQVGKKLLLEFEYLWSNVDEAGRHVNTVGNTVIQTWNYTTTSASLNTNNLLIPFSGALVKSGSASNISSIIYGRFSRIVKKASWTYPDLTTLGLDNDNFDGSLWLFGIDFHRQIDSLGSRSSSDK